jgi:hypothetical protein
MEAAVRAVIALFTAVGLAFTLPTTDSPAKRSFEGSQPIVTVPQTTVPQPPTTTEYLRTTIVSCDDVTAIMLEQGWPASELAYGTEIAWRESRCFPWVLNAKDPQGGSIGLFQINRFWCLPNRWTPNGWLQDQGIIESCDDLYHATLNIRAALAIWKYADAKHGNGWGPWSSAHETK